MTRRSCTHNNFITVGFEPAEHKNRGKLRKQTSIEGDDR